MVHSVQAWGCPPGWLALGDAGAFLLPWCPCVLHLGSQEEGSLTVRAGGWTQAGRCLLQLAGPAGSGRGGGVLFASAQFPHCHGSLRLGHFWVCW